MSKFSFFLREVVLASERSDPLEASSPRSALMSFGIISVDMKAEFINRSLLFRCDKPNPCPSLWITDARGYYLFGRLVLCHYFKRSMMVFLAVFRRVTRLYIEFVARNRVTSSLLVSGSCGEFAVLFMMYYHCLFLSPNSAFNYVVSMLHNVCYICGN